MTDCNQTKVIKRTVKIYKEFAKRAEVVGLKFAIIEIVKKLAEAEEKEKNYKSLTNKK